MSGKSILSVGQCSADHGSISRMLRQSLGANVIAAHSSDEAVQQLRNGQFSLVLVNRVFDGDATEGIELIRQLKADPSLQSVPVMLVSNYADAQQKAVEAGALPGFGKSSLGSSDTIGKLKAVL